MTGIDEHFRTIRERQAMTKAQYIKDMPAKQYHSDPFDEMSLSSGMVRTLANKTPRHLKEENARLNPLAMQKTSKSMDKGTAIHETLMGGDGIAWLDFPDFKTNAAKEARAAVHEAGKAPMLLKEKEEIDKICSAVKEQIKKDPENNDALQSGDFESSAFWYEKIDNEHIFCRARFDNVDFEQETITDIKTTNVLANNWERTQLFGNKYYLQAEHYIRAFEAIADKSPKRFRFLVIEQEPPYLIRFIEVHHGYLDMIKEYYENILRTWKHCLKTGFFLGYPAGTRYAHMPSYEINEIENKNYLMEEYI